MLELFALHLPNIQDFTRTKQSKHSGIDLHMFLLFLPPKLPFLPNKVSLTIGGLTQPVLEKEEKIYRFLVVSICKRT